MMQTLQCGIKLLGELGGKCGVVETDELVAVSDAAGVFLGELGGFYFDGVSILFEFGDGILGVMDFKDADSELVWCLYRHKEKINLAGHEEKISLRYSSSDSSDLSCEFHCFARFVSSSGGGPNDVAFGLRSVSCRH
ncbi:hypothetical protein ACFX2H_019804 [Malus domestica]